MFVPTPKKFLHDHPRIHISIWFLTVLIPLVPVFNYGKQVSISNQNQVIVDQTLGVGDTTEIEKDTCMTIPLPENRLWDVSRFNNKGMAWTPKKEFTAPTMWELSGYALDFKKILIEYQVTKLEKYQDNNPPAIIYSLGEEIEGTISAIFSAWTPEGDNLQLIRIEDADGEDSKGLNSPVKAEQLDTIEILPTNFNGKEINYNLNYTYTSNLIDQSLTDTKTIRAKFNSSNIQNSSQKVHLGLGTYYGHKIELKSAKICY